MQRVPSIAGCVLLTLLMAACGFHLRGSYQLPRMMLTGTYVNAPANDPELVRALKRGLANAGAVLVDDPTQASATVHIVEDRQARDVLSVNAQGRPREYELAKRVRFRVDTPQGVLLPEQEFTLRHIQSFSEGELLAAGQESQFLFAQLSRDAANRILRQLSSLGTAARVKGDAETPAE